MIRLRRPPAPRPTEAEAQRAREQEERLQSAEKRANALIQAAEWVATAVARRDQENHWQASVNRLFLGESP